MSNRKINNSGRAWWGALVSVAALCVVIPFVFAQGKDKTAQSIMVDISTEGSHFVVDGQETWAYNKSCALGYYSNVLLSGPVVTCTGGGPGGVNCAPANKPATPDAPAADPTKLNSSVNSDGCTFWNGGALSINGPGTYKQSVPLNGLNGSGNWKFEWTYQIGVNPPGTVDARTCWGLQSSNTSAAELTFEARIAAESVTLQKNNAIPKASFTLKNSDGTSRVENLRFELLDALSTVVSYGPLDHLVKVGTDYPELNSFFDVFYSANAGSYGTTSLLFNNMTIGAILDGDGFANNNTTASGGPATSMVADSVPQTVFISSPGNYTLWVRGSMKGNEGGASAGFGVTTSVCVNAGTCSLCPQ